MGKEIERKFLVKNDIYKEMAKCRREMAQGYLSRNPDATVRVRVAGTAGYITVKGRNDGAVRDEWEYSIPAADAEAMLRLCPEGSVLSKTRYLVDFGGRTWEVDEFHGHLEGLVVAEVELDSAGAEVEIPPFASTEVTGDARYYNSNLCKHGIPQ